MSPPPATGRSRMGACETTPPTMRAGETSQRPPYTSTQGRLFLAPYHRPPLAGVKLVRPRPRLPARRCGRSSLTPGRATAPNRSDEEKPRSQSRPARRPRARPPGEFAMPLDSRGPYGCGNRPSLTAVRKTVRAANVPKTRLRCPLFRRCSVIMNEPACADAQLPGPLIRVKRSLMTARAWSWEHGSICA